MYLTINFVTYLRKTGPGPIVKGPIIKEREQFVSRHISSLETWNSLVFLVVFLLELLSRLQAHILKIQLKFKSIFGTINVVGSVRLAFGMLLSITRLNQSTKSVVG